MPVTKKLLFNFQKKLRDGSMVNVPVEGLEGSDAFYFQSGMSIDADGAPNAYDPENKKGLDFLGNAGYPGNWWALATDTGEKDGTPLIQQDDPYKGFYISETSLKDLTKPTGDVKRNVDASTVPYFVLPTKFMHETSVEKGDLSMVIYPKTGKISFAVFGDTGPAGILGEGSIALGDALGIPTQLRKKNAGTEKGVIYLVFPGSATDPPWPRDLSEMQSATEKLFAEFGGIEIIKELFPEYY